MVKLQSLQERAGPLVVLRLTQKIQHFAVFFIHQNGQSPRVIQLLHGHYLYAYTKTPSTSLYIFLATHRFPLCTLGQVTDTFRETVAELVGKCGGSQSEAARRAGISTAMISRTLAGQGPRDPKGATLAKIHRALGRPTPYTMSAPAPMVVRENGELADDILKLSIWIRNNPQAWPFVLNAARGQGYKET